MQPGDSLFLHFSGHGGQVRDTSKYCCFGDLIDCFPTDVIFVINEDGDEDDGFDEVFCN